MEGAEEEGVRGRQVSTIACIQNRVVLVGKLVPNSEFWEHIIIPAGGHVVVTNGSKTEEVKSLAAEEGIGMRLCVMKEKPKHSRLVDYLDESNFIFVTTAYVGLKWMRHV